ncbi:hypothetical protein ACF0H5_013590 [Mactra antiquata]
MCSSANSASALMPFGMKLSAGQFPYYSAGSPHLTMEIHRAQLQDYAQRLQLGLRSFPGGQVAGVNPLAYHGHVMHPYLHPYFCKDPRTRFVHEEPKPNHSYIGLIAMAILSSREKKLVLSDIYQWILDNYSYFRTRGPGWRNSIRHNLSLNDCFIKAGRSANGKGHYWAIHPANMDDFQKGDFRRRRAQRRVRKHMGLSVPDDDDDDSPLPSPAPQQADWVKTQLDGGNIEGNDKMNDDGSKTNTNDLINLNKIGHDSSLQIRRVATNGGFRRQFDVESLLAPEPEYYRKMRTEINTVNFEEPADIFAIGNIKHKNEEFNRDNEYGVESENEDTNKDNRIDSVSGESSPSTSRDFSKSIHCSQPIKSQISNKINNFQDRGDGYETNDSNSSGCSPRRCVISVDDNDYDESNRNSDKGSDNDLEGKSNGVADIDDNNKESDGDVDKSGQQVVNPQFGYLHLNNFTNSNTDSVCPTDKQAYFSQIGKLVRFPFHPQHTLLTGLGGQLDIETAHRWQQSMASLLMKAQVKE